MAKARPRNDPATASVAFWACSLGAYRVACSRARAALSTWMSTDPRSSGLSEVALPDSSDSRASRASTIAGRTVPRQSLAACRLVRRRNNTATRITATTNMMASTINATAVPVNPPLFVAAGAGVVVVVVVDVDVDVVGGTVVVVTGTVVVVAAQAGATAATVKAPTTSSVPATALPTRTNRPRTYRTTGCRPGTEPHCPRPARAMTERLRRPVATSLRSGSRPYRVPPLVCRPAWAASP